LGILPALQPAASIHLKTEHKGTLTVVENCREEGKKERRKEEVNRRLRRNERKKKTAEFAENAER